jgi:ppGpp synthetase/RelA/SpoT-type nucleotidyltranferase
MARTIRSIAARYLKKYEKELSHYKKAAGLAEELVQEILFDSRIQIHAITSRHKTLDSLRLKLKLKQYKQPGKQLTDKIGVRIITYFESDIAQVTDLLEKALEINTAKSEDKRTKLSLREFGYRSVHLIARTKGRFARLLKYEPIRHMWFEIQVRSILEHAWAEIEHEVVYKSGIAFSDETKRRFARLAGALEILENEFLALRSERWKLVDAYVAAFKKESKISRDTLDSAKVIALLEVERPNGLGWRSTSGTETGFPPGIEAVCAAALRSAGIKSSGVFRRVLRSQAIRTAEKNFTALSLQAPTHLASALIAVAIKSPSTFRDYFPDMITNSAIEPLLRP